MRLPRTPTPSPPSAPSFRGPRSQPSKSYLMYGTSHTPRGTSCSTPSTVMVCTHPLQMAHDRHSRPTITAPPIRAALARQHQWPPHVRTFILCSCHTPPPARTPTSPQPLLFWCWCALHLDQHKPPTDLNAALPSSSAVVPPRVLRNKPCRITHNTTPTIRRGRAHIHPPLCHPPLPYTSRGCIHCNGRHRDRHCLLLRDLPLDCSTQTPRACHPSGHPQCPANSTHL